MQPHDTIRDMIEFRATSDPGAPAVLASDGRRVTYGELSRLADRFRAELGEFGIGPGDTVAVVLPNGPEMALTFLCVTSAVTCAPLNPGYQEPEFDFYLGDLAADALITLVGDTSVVTSVATARQIPCLDLTPLTADIDSSLRLSGDRGPGTANASRDVTRPDDVALVLHTSGTTSRPKIVPLLQSNLTASAVNIAETLELTPVDRCLNVMPLFHIHGLMAALLSSVAAGAQIVATEGFVATRFFDWLDEYEPTWFTAVPTMHQSILARSHDHASVVDRCRLRFLRSSSASLPPQVMEGLEATFHAPMIEAYGMTEASHQMTSNRLPPGLRKSGSVGAQAGPEVAIMSESEGRLLPEGQVGEIVIRGANVTPGYRNNSQANAAAFTDGWFRTGDQGHFDEDGYLFISGRLKEIINRGGEKVSPREIDEVLLTHPDVVQALTFAVPDARLGEDIGVAVVLTPGAQIADQDLRRFVSERLADFKVPSVVVRLDEIPKGATGKLQRIGFAEKLGITGRVDAVDVHADTDETSAVEPATPTERTLADIWSEVLEIDPVGVTSRFLDVGGDSILATKLAMQIRRQLEVEFAMVEFFEAATIRQQAALVDRSNPRIAD